MSQLLFLLMIRNMILLKYNFFSFQDYGSCWRSLHPENDAWLFLYDRRAMCNILNTSFWQRNKLSWVELNFIISFMILSMILFMASFMVSFMISTIYFISSLLDNKLEEMRYCMVFHLCCANQGTWYVRTWHIWIAVHVLLSFVRSFEMWCDTRLSPSLTTRTWGYDRPHFERVVLYCTVL